MNTRYAKTCKLLGITYTLINLDTTEPVVIASGLSYGEFTKLCSKLPSSSRYTYTRQRNGKTI